VLRIWGAIVRPRPSQKSSKSGVERSGGLAKTSCSCQASISLIGYVLTQGRSLLAPLEKAFYATATLGRIQCRVFLRPLFLRTCSLRIVHDVQCYLRPAHLSFAVAADFALTAELRVEAGDDGVLAVLTRQLPSIDRRNPIAAPAVDRERLPLRKICEGFQQLVPAD